MVWQDQEGQRGRVITLVFFMRRHGLCMLVLDGTFAQAEMPVYPRILHFFVTKCVHVYPDGRLVLAQKWAHVVAYLMQVY